MSSECSCGHSAYDHKSSGASGPHRGECLRCWCSSFDALNPSSVEVPNIRDYTSLSSNASVLDWVIERIERKACPQGLNVLAEELQWMGQAALTFDKLYKAVSNELRRPHSRLIVVSEGIYWLNDKSLPAGWSMFGKGMLPCFYREYPPDIPWEKFDCPENVLPRPRTRDYTLNSAAQQTTDKSDAAR